jgi:Iron dependent repressor, N-terminal DNA binding domain
MGRPTTLLEGLCGHALGLGAQSIKVEHKNGRQLVYAGEGAPDADRPIFKSSRDDAEELLDDLLAALKKPVRAAFHGRAYLLNVTSVDRPGEEDFTVSIDPAPKPDAAHPPKFTAKQGQYLAYIYSYTKIHRCAPAESDLQLYFQVSAPSVHEMIKTLERNGLIERTPGRARSIRLCVPPESLPRLD